MAYKGYVARETVEGDDFKREDTCDDALDRRPAWVARCAKAGTKQMHRRCRKERVHRPTESVEQTETIGLIPLSSFEPRFRPAVIELDYQMIVGDSEEEVSSPVSWRLQGGKDRDILKLMSIEICIQLCEYTFRIFNDEQVIELVCMW